MKISVITPSFNSVQFIERAINSVLKQNYDDVEHIVIDAGSKDGTVEILKKYPHLIWVSEPDKGQSDAMNKGFAKSTGNLIAYLNADDEFYPGWFSMAQKAFVNDPAADMVVGDMEINRMGAIESYKPSTRLKDILNYQKFKFPLNPVSYIYKRDLQTQIGPFPLNNTYTMDYWFLLRAYLYGKVVKCNFVSGIFYIDGNNKTSDLQKALDSLKADRTVFNHQFRFHSKLVLLKAKAALLSVKKVMKLKK